MVLQFLIHYFIVIFTYGKFAIGAGSVPCANQPQNAADKANITFYGQLKKNLGKQTRDQREN